MASDYTLIPGTPELLPLDSLAALFQWYLRNLCKPEIRDCRGYRVRFLETDFVHLIKLIDQYGRKPKNRRMTIDQIGSGRVQLVQGRFDVRRAQELSWARSILQQLTIIVPNWQVMGKAKSGRGVYQELWDD